MKVSPVMSGAPASVNPNEGMSAGADRMARAKAIALGQEPAAAPVVDAQVARAQDSIRRIKLRTQQSPGRQNRLDTPAEPKEVVAEAATPPKSDELATTEQVEAASEATKPLSPQFAALARQKREIQLAQQKLDADKAALETSKTNDLSGYVSKADLKANALKVLLAEGVTYDQLTEEILASNQENPDLVTLKSDVKTLKEGLENQTKSIADREAATEKQALAQIGRETEQLISQGDDYEMIREAGYAPKVVDLIHKIWKTEGVVLDTAEAAGMIESALLEESIKFARIKKVQSRLAPAQTEKPLPVQQDRPGTKVMRTLTNRDGVSSTTMSKRERAIAAMEGRLK